MVRSNPWSFWGGLALIVLGGLFLLGTLLGVSFWAAVWPLIIVAAGLGFFIPVLAGGRALSVFAIPGSVLVTLGLILFFQSVLGIWATWAYAWALLISGAGVGLFLFGTRGAIPELRQAGRVVIFVGLILFFVFGAFFELGASLLGLESPGGLFWPILLILAGLYVLFGNWIRTRAGGPVAEKTFDFQSSAVVSTGEQGDPGAKVEGSAAGVRRLMFRALGDLTITQGPNESLKIEAPQFYLDRLRAEVKRDTLDISFDNQWWSWLNPINWNAGTVRYALQVADLQAVSHTGLGKISIPGLTTSRLTVHHSGAGELVINQLQAGELVVDQSGVGSISVDGRVDRQEIHLSGAGSYQARHLESELASAQISGVGSATLRVRETFDAKISGTGSVEYYGSPRLNQHVSGVGSVRRIGG